MKKILILLVFLFLGIGISYAQSKVYEGVLRDKDSNERLAYVNIGVLNKNLGTVSDANGKFRLVLDDTFNAELLKISMIGYKSISFSVVDFKKRILENEVLLLERDISELKEIVICPKKYKTVVLGNELERKTVSAGFVNNLLGNEIGIIIKNKKGPLYIDAFHAVVDYNNYGEMKFRINFYDLKNGLPNNTLLHENIIAKSILKKGKLTIDLSEYNIVVNGDFFVSIELIESLGEGGLHFLADYSGAPVITRSASQGKWNKQDDVSFGFTVTAKY